MSYTLRGRIESRLASALLPFLAACVLAAALPAWWPLELAGLMAGVGLALDLAYHPLLPYQPGWLALPLGALELGAIMVLARALHVAAPVTAAVAFFALSWLLAQVLAHAGFPLLRLTYAEDGGELGRAGPALAVAAPLALLTLTGFAWTSEPPTVRLSSGIHRGPLVLDRAQKLVGEPGAIVRGGIVITSDDVTVRNVIVVGGSNGIDVQDANDVVLDGVGITGAKLDGIHVRGSEVAIRRCTIDSRGNEWAQGIDISFSYHRAPSLVERCTVLGGREGIVTHSTMAMLTRNHVTQTTLRGITMTEMSMGHVDRNRIEDALGVGIYCGDYSECEIDHNSVVGTRPDRTSDDASRHGYAIQAHYFAVAELGRHNGAGRIGAFGGARVVHD
jgi:nitrous oxidase accessory protein NosD